MCRAGELMAGLENLEPEHVEILLRILHAATLEDAEGDDQVGAPYQLAAQGSAGAPVPEPFAREADRWLAVLRKIELHVYVALADDELCDNIVIVSCRGRVARRAVGCSVALLAVAS